jgi:hypothetical protein
MSYSPLSQSNYNSNYILAGDASFGLKGFANYSNTAGVAPVTGTGGSPATTLAITTASPLSGTSSFLWAKSGANRQGEGFSYNFTIDNALRGQQLAINFLYEILSGSYATGDMSVWVYNITDNVMVQPSGYQIISTGIAGPSQQMVFQASATSTSYRLIFHTASTNASAYSLKFDNITVTPQTGGYGLKARPTTIQRFTSGSGTYTPPAGVYQIKVTMSGGGGGGAGDGVGAGSGGTGGSTTFGGSTTTGGGGGIAGGGSPGAGGTYTVGSAHTAIISVAGGPGQGGYPNAATNSGIGGSGGNNPFGGGAGGGGYNQGGFTSPNNTGGGGGGAGASSSVATNGGAGGGAGGYLQFIQSAPTSQSYSIGAGGTAGTAGAGAFAGGVGGSGVIIVEEYYYGDNVITSDSAATRVVAARATTSGSPTANPNNTYIKLAFNSVLSDTHGAFDTVNNRYIVKTPGSFQVIANAVTAGTNVLNNLYFLSIYKNGSLFTTGQSQFPPATSNMYMTVSAFDPSAVVGDYYEVYIYGQGNNSGTPISFFVGGTTTSFSVNMVQGPAQIQAATVVAAAAVAATSTHFATASTLTGWTELEDTTNSFNPTTGIFTAPAPGLYRYTGSYSPNNTALPSSIYLYKNGSNYQNRRSSSYSNGVVYPNPTLTGLIRLNTNDQVYFVAQNSSGVATATDGGGTSFSIERISGVN